MSYFKDITKANALYKKADHQAALPLYLKYSEQGDVDCSRMAAWIYFDSNDLESAFDLFKPGVESGDLEACLGLARVHLSRHHHQKALAALEPLAKQSYPPAIYWLAQINEKGIGCSANLQKAIELYAKAAEYGHVKSTQREFRLLLSGKAGFIGRLKAPIKFLRLLKLSIDIGANYDSNDPRFLI